MAQFTREIDTHVLKGFLRELSISCHIAIDRFYNKPEYEVLNDDNIDSILAENNFQIFIKNALFANDMFAMQVVNNKYMGTVYVISRASGQGHLQFLGLRRNGNHSLSIGYVSFFDGSDGFGNAPSNKLIEYYKYIKRRVSELKTA